MLMVKQIKHNYGQENHYNHKTSHSDSLHQRGSQKFSIWILYIGPLKYISRGGLCVCIMLLSIDVVDDSLLYLVGLMDILKRYKNLKGKSK